MKNSTLKIGLGCTLLLLTAMLAHAGQPPPKFYSVADHRSFEAKQSNHVVFVMHNYYGQDHFDAVKFVAQPMLIVANDYHFFSPIVYARPVNDPKPDNTLVQLIRQRTMLKLPSLNHNC